MAVTVDGHSFRSKLFSLRPCLVSEENISAKTKRKNPLNVYLALFFQWSKLFEPEVWLDAASQIFYSFGLAFGCLIALSSYNPIRNDFAREALIVTVSDFFTSIFTACVVFSILGKTLFFFSHLKFMKVN